MGAARIVLVRPAAKLLCRSGITRELPNSVRNEEALGGARFPNPVHTRCVFIILRFCGPPLRHPPYNARRLSLTPPPPQSFETSVDPVRLPLSRPLALAPWLTLCRYSLPRLC